MKIVGQVFDTGRRDGFAVVIGLIGTLTLLLAIVAGLGVLNTVVLHTRERVHDLGVFKAVGMTPRQAIVMVVCWVAGTGPAPGRRARSPNDESLRQSSGSGE